MKSDFTKRKTIKQKSNSKIKNHWERNNPKPNNQYNQLPYQIPSYIVEAKGNQKHILTPVTYISADQSPITSPFNLD